MVGTSSLRPRFVSLDWNILVDYYKVGLGWTYKQLQISDQSSANCQVSMPAHSGCELFVLLLTFYFFIAFVFHTVGRPSFNPEESKNSVFCRFWRFEFFGLEFFWLAFGLRIFQFLARRLALFIRVPTTLLPQTCIASGIRYTSHQSKKNFPPVKEGATALLKSELSCKRWVL